MDGYRLSWDVTAQSSPAEKKYTADLTNEENEQQSERAEAVLSAVSANSALLQSVGNPVLNQSVRLLTPKRYELQADSEAIVVKDELPVPQEDSAFIVQDVSSQITYEDVLPNIDFTYAVRPEKIKEEIIINAPTGLTSYHTKIEAPGLKPSLREDRSVTFQNSQGEEIFGIPTPFMYDREGELSYDIVVQLEILDDDTCNVIYIPNYDWLQAPERVYPVTLDPTFYTTPALYGPNVTQDTYASTTSPNTNYSSSPYMTVGRSYYSYLKFNNLPTISDDYIIQGATITIACESANAGNIDIDELTSSWNENTVTWNNKPKTGGRFSAFDVYCDNHYYRFDATTLVANWYANKYPNYGVMISASSSSSGSWSLCTSNHSRANAQPYIQVSYYPMYDANLPTGTYFIQNYSNNRYLDATSGVAANGTNVETTSFHGNNSQQ